MSKVKTLMQFAFFRRRDRIGRFLIAWSASGGKLPSENLIKYPKLVVLAIYEFENRGL